MTSSLGKRKERDDEQVTHGSTLFVSNLPYQVTSVDLQTLFSDIAPVRSAFVVLESGTGVSKGVGYVSFALREDAQSALEKISREGIQIAGRNLRVQFADSKPKDREKRETKPRPTPRTRPQAPKDPLAIRPIVVSGLPSSVDAKALWKKFRKYGAEKVEWPVKTDDGRDDASIAHVLFNSPSTAFDAVEKLHAHVFKGALLSVALKKRMDALSKSHTKSPKDVDEEKAGQKTVTPGRGSRLIVRNIPFNTTEQDLRAIFLPYGPIHSIVIPTLKEATSTSSRKERIKGFAFIWMLSKKDAEKALEGCNGLVVRPGVAEELRLDKQIKKKQRRMDKKKETTTVDENADHEAVQDINGRTIAVDWALSKDKWEEEMAKYEGSDNDEHIEGHSGSSDNETDSILDSDLDENDSSDRVDQDEDVVADSDAEQPIKPQLPDTDVGTTVFIRNVPFEATEDELRALLRAFGPLRYARITVDEATGRSRGTGFACFWNKEDADKVLSQSELLRSETTGVADTPAPKNPFILPSILTPDPSSTLARNLVLGGRTLDIVRAVTRHEASRLKQEGEKRREKADKRNMYLLREGTIPPNSPAALVLSPADMERRTASFNSRKALLNSNPALYISKTRLSIRQIPTFVTEHMLKRLATYSIKAFDDDVAEGSREGLAQDELEDSVFDKTSQKNQSKGRSAKVKQAKIVRQQERADPVTGKARSKGYGFLEMHQHSDALRVLRWANNNPEVGRLFDAWWREELADLLKAEKAKEPTDETRIKRISEELQTASKKNKGTLIVEFSIENTQVVQRRVLLQKEQAESSESKKRKTKASSDEPSSKRQKTVPEPLTEEKKLGSSIGSLIGRKRRRRKGGKN